MKASSSPSSPPDYTKVVAQADAAMERFDHEAAAGLYEIAIPLAKEKTSLFEKLADCKVALGDQDGAKACYEEALQETTDPVTRASMAMYIGQLSIEGEALRYYQQGIQQLEGCIQQIEREGSGKMNGNTLEDLRSQLARAHCTVAELYLTDLCFSESAEEQCELHVNKALEYRAEDDGKPLVDALQVAASLRLSQQLSAEELMNQVYAQIGRGCEALSRLVDEESAELVEIDEADGLPNFEFRCHTSTLLLEAGLAEKAIIVLKSLMAESDEVVQIWYLLGCAHQAIGSNDVARSYWERALEMLAAVKQGLDEEMDETELQECEAQMEDITSKLEDLNEEMDG